MSRYTPTRMQQQVIDELRLAGYAVVRQGTYDNLLKRVSRADSDVRWHDEMARAASAWARDCITEERRLSRRLNEVCTAAATLGVSIHDINAALQDADAKARA